MDPDKSFFTSSTAHAVGAIASTAMNYGQDRLDCKNLESVTDKWTADNRPSFVTVLLRFFGNIFVDCFRSIFE